MTLFVLIAAWIAITLFALHTPRVLAERGWDIVLEEIALILPLLAVFGGLAVCFVFALIETVK